MGPFENIQIPNESDGNAIECWSDLIANINEYFDQEWRYLNSEDVTWILDRLWDDNDSCQQEVKEWLAELNSDMFKNGVNLQAGWIWEERFLSDFWVDPSELKASIPNFPDQYSMRTSWDYIIFSDTEWNPLINLDTSSWVYEEPWYTTWIDNKDDNINWWDYVVTEAIIQNWKTNEANNEIDAMLEEWSIQIDELENREAHENIARLYNLDTAAFQNALQYFIEKSNISLFHQNANMRLLSDGNFQISADLYDFGWEHHVTNFFPNGELESEYTF